MNKYIRKLGFRSSDEMEMKVTIRAIRVAWFYVIIFLLGWAVINAINVSDGKGDIRVSLIIVALVFTAELLYFALQWWFTKKAVDESKSEHHDIKVLKAKGRGKNSYEYIYEDEDGNQYIYEEVPADQETK